MTCVFILFRFSGGVGGTALKYSSVFLGLWSVHSVFRYLINRFGAYLGYHKDGIEIGMEEALKTFRNELT